MPRSLFVLAVAVCVQLVAPASASAFIFNGWPTPRMAGHTIRTSFLSPDVSTSFVPDVDAVVGSNVELTAFAGLSDIDFGDSAIILTLLYSGSGTPAEFNGWRFTDINHSIDRFQSVVVRASTLTDPFVVTFDDDNIFVNAGSGQMFGAGQYLILTIPEPSTAWLVASALAFIALRIRRR